MNMERWQNFFMFDHVSSCDKLGLLNLPYQNVYGQQTCPLAEDL